MLLSRQLDNLATKLHQHARRNLAVAAAARSPFGSHMSNNNPETIEREKEKSLKGETVSPIPEAPHWSEPLASDSEAIIKAERYATEDDVMKLQEETIEIIREQEDLDKMLES